MRTLFFDCFAGASGNMILGGLIALGVDRRELVRQIKLLNTAAFEIEFTTVDRSGISCIHTDVRVPNESRHRHLSDIRRIIDESALSETIKLRANAIFASLAEAEASVHGIEIEKVHFHEVGALDAIVDIVGACAGFELMGIERFACSKIHVGSGFIDIAHGKFPVPAPAVAKLLAGVPVYSTEIDGELITPTAAAIITTVCNSYGTIPEMVVEADGYGAGTREYTKFPNALRLILGNSTSTISAVPGRETVVTLETNIDDLSPQILGFVMDRAFELGALDCWFTPIQMKKNRPAAMLSVLCEPEKADELRGMIYAETTSIGIRSSVSERDCLEREIVSVSTVFGPIDVKIAKFNGVVVNVMPEYEHVKKAALEKGVAFRVVSDGAVAAVDRNARPAANN